MFVWPLDVAGHDKVDPVFEAYTHDVVKEVNDFRCGLRLNDEEAAQAVGTDATARDRVRPQDGSPDHDKKVADSGGGLSQPPLFQYNN